MVLHRLRQLFTTPPPEPLEAPTFAVPDNVRVYAVGDIHGRCHLLSKMLAAIARDAASANDKEIIEIFLGDYVDRGMQSREVIETLLAAPAEHHERICLLGNHEEALLRFLNDPQSMRGWGNIGGYATLASYGIGIPESMSPEHLSNLRNRLQGMIPEAHLEFLKTLKLNYILGDYLFVHAGIMPGVPVEKQRPEHLLWIRDPFLHYEGFFENYYVVHGHSAVSIPEIRVNRANLDVSEADIDSLCCLVLEGTERRTLLVTNLND